MSRCGNKISSRCGTTTNAVCVKYQGDLPEDLKDSCFNVEEVIEEIFKDLKSIKDSIKIEGLGNDCVHYSSKATLLEVLKKHEEKICAISNGGGGATSGVTDIANTPIGTWGLDTKCLEDYCGRGTIGSVKDLFQTLITKVCDMNQEIIELKRRP